MKLFKILYRDTENYIECDEYRLSEKGQSTFYKNGDLVHCVPKSAVVIDVTPEDEIVGFLTFIMDKIDTYASFTNPNLINDIPIEDKEILRVESSRISKFWKEIDELKTEFKRTFNLNN